MKNYVQDGNTLALTNSGNTTISRLAVLAMVARRGWFCCQNLPPM